MTTSRTPLRVLKQQAQQIAQALKAMEGTENLIALDPSGKLTTARKQETIKFAIAMDDKIITITLGWELIKETSETEITEYILNFMHGTRSN